MTVTLIQQSEIQPKGVGFIAFTQMWESFSFYGMRALLILYLVSEGGYSYVDAVILYTLYIAFVKVFAAGGGYAVDKFLGYKRAVLIGGCFILTGHLLLTFSSELLLSLGCIVCGSALFRVSLQALLSLLYAKDDPRREKGFTFLYMGMNLGGLLAAVLCGFVAEIYGWHVGFGLAAFGMVVGMGFFMSQIKMFSQLETVERTSLLFVLPACGICAGGVGVFLNYFQIVHAFVLPFGILGFIGILVMLRKKMSKESFTSVTVSFLLLIMFSAAEELCGSLLMVFSEMHIDRTLFGIEIPSATIAAINPLTIIFFGPLIAKVSMSYKVRLSLAFLSLASAFFVLNHVSMIGLGTGLLLIALGELLLCPAVMSFASKSAPCNRAGMMMGATTLALSMGTLLSGEIAKISADPQAIFLLVGSVSLGIFILLSLKSPSAWER